MADLQTESSKLVGSTAFQEARDHLVTLVRQASSRITGVRPPASPAHAEKLRHQLVQFQKDRGRDLYFPFLASGLGNGPFVEIGRASCRERV